MKHVLALSTIFPNPVAPRFGTFVARSLEALARQRIDAPDGSGSRQEAALPRAWRVSVVNPIGTPPLAVGRYKQLAQLSPRDEVAGLDVHRLQFALIPKLSARRNAASIAKAALPTIRAIHESDPIDIIDAQFFFPDGPAAAIIAKELGLPLTIKARGSDINYWGRQSFARRQMIEAAQQANGLLAVSAALKGEMEALGFPADKIALHYTGLDRDRFRPLDHTQLRAQLARELGFDLPAGAAILSCIGALNGRKGQDIAIKALTLLPDARLILVGTGEERAALADCAAAQRVSDRVHFAGAVDHDLLPIILSASDAMVLPTKGEGLANAWVEALACGTPVITCDVGGARELINDERAGRLVERDPEAFASAISAVLENPTPRAEVASLVERFDWNIHAKELAAYYDRLLARRQ